MKFQVLMATMDRCKETIPDLIKDGHLHTDVLLINQCDREAAYELCVEDKKIQVWEKNERGLSRSRNCALVHSEAEIGLIADDDIRYEANIEALIVDAFEQHPEYDLIAFYVERSRDFAQKEMGKPHRVRSLQSLSLMSVQVAVRLAVIKEKGLRFDENFGAGSGRYICGEENVFMMDCLRAGCKIGYVPILIAHTEESPSSWFHGYDQEYFISKGAVFYRLFPHCSGLLVLAFALLKRNLYRQDMGMRAAYRYMMQGKRACKKQYREMKK